MYITPAILPDANQPLRSRRCRADPSNPSPADAVTLLRPTRVHPQIDALLQPRQQLTGAICVGGYITRQTWLRFTAESLVCQASEARSDIVLVDLVEYNYLLFERAQQLQASGLASIVLVPILSSERYGSASSVALGFVEVMCRVARVSDCTTFPAPVAEPISLNLARRTAEELRARGIHSVLLVTEGFRSRRAAMVYSEVLRPLGIAVHCQPVFGLRTLDNWFESSHGIQDVALQFAKLLYYRVGVMPGV